MHQFIVPRRRPCLKPSRALAVTAPETKGAKAQGVGVPPRRAVRRSARPPIPTRIACRAVRQLVLEMTAMAGERPVLRRDNRRATCHVRQIAMYVCHVVLRLSLSDIGAAFGRDRTTVGHACHVVEDRRDDPAFDAFVSAIERMVFSVFGPAGLGCHE